MSSLAHYPNPYLWNGMYLTSNVSDIQPILRSVVLSRFHKAFEELGKPPQIYLAINSEDSSIVYYKLSPGIVKPPV